MRNSPNLRGEWVIKADSYEGSVSFNPNCRLVLYVRIYA